MIAIETIRECLRHNDWARDKILAAAAGMSDAQLDQPFAMGPGSLRATIQHLYGAERTWFVRWQGADQPQFPHSRDLAAPAAIREAQQNLADARDRELAALRNADLARNIDYVMNDGRPGTSTLGDILLHVYNHGVHHRSQAMNLLRQLGAELPKPGLDYLFMKLERPEVAPWPPDAGTLQAYYAYGDWAQHRVFRAAQTLTDEQLDRQFELGMGSVRASLVHICLAERWWLDNWLRGPGNLFPTLPEHVPLADIAQQFEQAVAGRDEILGRATRSDLERPVSATPRPGVTRTFPLAETMLQLCHHGTHHRAQVSNMLRQLGVQAPVLDYIAMTRERR